jgi:hypothetical protein
VKLSSPLFLVVCAPQVDVGSDDFYARRVDLPGDPVYTVCNRMDGSGYWLPCTVVRGWDPYQAHYRGIPYADYYRDDDLEAALAMPPMAGVEFRDGHLVWQDAGSSYLPWQGTRPRVMVIRHYVPWSY